MRVAMSKPAIAASRIFVGLCMEGLGIWKYKNKIENYEHDIPEEDMNNDAVDNGGEEGEDGIEDPKDGDGVGQRSG